MRKALKKLGSNERLTFTATFERTGFKQGYKGPIKTVLLIDVKDSEGNLITDHLWFNSTLGFERANLVKGDLIQFNGRVAQYEKGYKGHRKDVYTSITQDYKISYPTKITKISSNEQKNQ